jgi:hypothetical protein
MILAHRVPLDFRSRFRRVHSSALLRTHCDLVGRNAFLVTLRYWEGNGPDRLPRLRNDRAGCADHSSCDLLGWGWRLRWRRCGLRSRACAGWKRGFTSFIQITATLGLFVLLAVILILQNAMTKEAFSSCWRIPFWISTLSASRYNTSADESPIQHIKGAGMTSSGCPKKPPWPNLKLVLISFWRYPDKAVVHGSFDALFHLQTTKADFGELHSRRRVAVVACALLFSWRL